MSRKLKFRAWDKKISKMTTYFSISSQGFIQSGDVGGYCTDGWRNKNFHIMQYIGLVYSTGKEIYEGDIFSYGGGIYREIKYVSSGFYAVTKEGDHIICRKHNMQLGKVIGNIHENPFILSTEDEIEDIYRKRYSITCFTGEDESAMSFAKYYYEFKQKQELCQKK